MINVEINDAAISAALSNLFAQLGDLTPVMESIGEILKTSTVKRFDQGISPAGDKWAANSPVTLARKKDPRPLFGPSGDLHQFPAPRVGADFAEITSNKQYSAMMQFGGTKAAFPHLWGDIPARPFLGLSTQDESDILDTISEALAAALTP